MSSYFGEIEVFDFKDCVNYDELLYRGKNGDDIARKQFIEYNLAIVIRVIVDEFSKYADMNELVSLGSLTLVKAFDNYDLNSSTKFLTYAYISITKNLKNYVGKSFKEKSPIISLNQPSFLLDDYSKISTLQDTLVSDEDITTDILNNLEYEYIIDVLNKILTEKERDIFLLRFMDNLTLEEIARKYNCSYENISLIIEKVRLKVKKYLISVGYENINLESPNKRKMSVNDRFELALKEIIENNLDIRTALNKYRIRKYAFNTYLKKVKSENIELKLAIEKYLNPLLQIFANNTIEQIADAINLLNDIEKELMLLRYPLDGSKGMKLKDIAQKYESDSSILSSRYSRIIQKVERIINSKQNDNEVYDANYSKKSYSLN